MNKRGPLVSFFGFSLILISLIVAVSSVPSELPKSESFLISSLFEDMFDYVSEPFKIVPGNVIYTSFSTYDSDIPLLWGIQILNYQNGDELSVKISNIFGDSYGEYIQSDSVYFETVFVEQSDTLNFEIENIGFKDVEFVIMFAEDPENSESLRNPNSPIAEMIVPLIVSGILLIVGIIVIIVGIILILFDLKNNFKNKKNF
ncbi:MAG: hypothetical protein ACPGN7_01480 [Nitrosopumilus sp.]|tara:strand:+ start:104 stop:709 length:606 start_codon:yes stop_codon:yes gene_type:complete